MNFFHWLLLGPSILKDLEDLKQRVTKLEKGSELYARRKLDVLVLEPRKPKYELGTYASYGDNQPVPINQIIIAICDKLGITPEIHHKRDTTVTFK